MENKNLMVYLYNILNNKYGKKEDYMLSMKDYKITITYFGRKIVITENKDSKSSQKENRNCKIINGYTLNYENPYNWTNLRKFEYPSLAHKKLCKMFNTMRNDEFRKAWRTIIFLIKNSTNQEDEGESLF